MTEKPDQKKTPETPSEYKTNWWTRLYFKFLVLRAKYKNTGIKWEKLAINFFIGLAFFSIAAGLIIFFLFLYKLSKDYSINGDNVILEKSGQVGDFIGGIVGSVWALTGVLLFYATLRLQSRELSENRKHFQISRLTDIIYKQLDLFNQQLVNFTLKDIEVNSDGEHIEYKGRTAISLLRHRVESILEVYKKENDVVEEKKAMFRFMGENFAFIEINKQELLNIYEELDNQTNVIRAVLIKEDIPPGDLNELKSIFFRNIGADFMKSSELLIHVIEWYITHQNKTANKLDFIFSPEHAIMRKIASIEEFRNKQYDKETIKQYQKSRDLYNLSSY